MLTQQPKASVSTSGWCRRLSGRSRRLEALSSQSQLKRREWLACAKLSYIKLLLSDIKSEPPWSSFQSLQQFVPLPKPQTGYFFSHLHFRPLCTRFSLATDIWKPGACTIFALLILKPNDKGPTMEKVQRKSSVLQPPCVYFSELSMSRPPGGWVHQGYIQCCAGSRPKGFSFTSDKFLIQLVNSLVTEIRKAS